MGCTDSVQTTSPVAGAGCAVVGLVVVLFSSCLSACVAPPARGPGAVPAEKPGTGGPGNCIPFELRRVDSRPDERPPGGSLGNFGRNHPGGPVPVGPLPVDALHRAQAIAVNMGPYKEPERDCDDYARWAASALANDGWDSTFTLLVFWNKQANGDPCPGSIGPPQGGPPLVVGAHAVYDIHENGKTSWGNPTPPFSSNLLPTDADGDGSVNTAPRAQAYTGPTEGCQSVEIFDDWGEASGTYPLD
jgi:hypothetical protein